MRLLTPPHPNLRLLEDNVTAFDVELKGEVALPFKCRRCRVTIALPQPQAPWLFALGLYVSKTSPTQALRVSAAPAPPLSGRAYEGGIFAQAPADGVGACLARCEGDVRCEGWVQKDSNCSLLSYVTSATDAAGAESGVALRGGGWRALVTADRSAAPGDGSRAARGGLLDLEEGVETVDVFVDGSVAEVFVNEGAWVGSIRVYGDDNCSGVTLAAEGFATASVRVAEMRSIWRETI
jgi:hypothetical protein